MSSLTVWARPGLPPRSLDKVILWEAFLPDDTSSDWISLPDYVHRERDDLRSRYQSWLTDVSQRALNGVTLADFMSIRTNLSYWWMTLPTDNSVAMDSAAYRVIRLFALSNVATELEFDHVTVKTGRPDVAEAITDWAELIGLPCTVDFSEPNTDERGRHQGTRGPILAMIRVFWNHLRIAMQFSRKAGRTAKNEGMIFVDYLAHLKQPGFNGAFRSNYWGPLVELLEDWPEPVHWLHVSANYATPKVISHDIDKCDTFNTVHPSHGLLHSYLNLKTVLKALRDYFQIRRFGKNLWQHRHVFIEWESELDPSALLHDLVEDQYFGRTAALNAFWINLWETTIDALPTQRLGVYLFENQPWELAFLSAWHKAKFGQILGFAHSTMSFWDFRYFPGNGSSNLRGKPTPSTVIVTGSLMREAALHGGLPEGLLSVAESLRTQADVCGRGAAIADLLVLGEYDVALDQGIIETAQILIDTFQLAPPLLYRPHPTVAIDMQTLPVEWSLSQHPSLTAALADCRVVLCGPASSAALDARMNGHVVFLHANPRALLSSAALDLPNVYIVASHDDVTHLKGTSVLGPAPRLVPMPALLDPQLTCWRALLSARGEH